MIINRQYKYLIKPNKRQKEIIIRTFGAVRFVHNRFLDDLKAGENMRGLAKDIVKRYKSEYEFLNDVDSTALMNVFFQLQDKTVNLDRYKTRKDSHSSYSISNLSKKQRIFIYENKYIYIPQLGMVEVVYHRPVPKSGLIKKVTIIRESDGKHFASLLVSFETEKPNINIDSENSIGLDYSSPHFYVDNAGRRVDMPHFYKQKEEKIAREEAKLKKCFYGSKNYYKQKAKVIKLYKNLKNQRYDFLHKLSNELADHYDVVCVESLDMKEIAGGLHMGKSTYDNAYATFINMLKYKLEEKGKLLLFADKYYPSSKTCHVCGSVNSNLTIKDRMWICPNCGAILDRDVNAAENIRQICLKTRFHRRVSGQSLK